MQRGQNLLAVDYSIGLCTLWNRIVRIKYVVHAFSTIEHGALNSAWKGFLTILIIDLTVDSGKSTS